MAYQLTEKQKKYLPVKRGLDIVIAGGAGIALAPVMAVLALAIKLDSPGPVLFKQKRVGRDKKLFEIWKFRTMRTDTPRDVPTHMLNDPEAYITRTGHFLRKYSLDELPQLYQCVLGQMSLIGPRPALWNQDDLIAERDKYGANSLTPGLTGWAQINGRDELEIPVKARFDGEYVEKFGFLMDVKCFLGTIGSVLSSDGVVEGGTGSLHAGEGDIQKSTSESETVVPAAKLKKEIRTGAAVVCGAAAAVISVFALIFRYAVSRSHTLHSSESEEGSHITEEKNKSHIMRKLVGVAALAGTAVAAYINVKRRVSLRDNQIRPDFEQNQSEPGREAWTGKETENLVRKILITGANSYIGTSMEDWLKRTPDRYQVDTLDMKASAWREYDFSGYDVVFHVAGIAHADVGNVTDEQRKLYYQVNTQLAVETAQKAKKEGVAQFIFMSSMIVYSGCEERMITVATVPHPENFYGDSKWQADRQIRAMSDENFRVVVLRPPMIYGKGSRGNYPLLSKMAGSLPVFPVVKNKRSMLYIENLCQFVKLMIDNEEAGIFFPQNGEYTNTSDMVQMIAQAKHHPLIMVPFMDFPVRLLFRIPGKIGTMAEKAFGDSAYDMNMSEYKEAYRVRTLPESIRLTEAYDQNDKE